MQSSRWATWATVRTCIAFSCCSFIASTNHYINNTGCNHCFFLLLLFFILLLGPGLRDFLPAVLQHYRYDIVHYDSTRIVRIIFRRGDLCLLCCVSFCFVLGRWRAVLRRSAWRRPAPGLRTSLSQETRSTSDTTGEVRSRQRTDRAVPTRTTVPAVLLGSTFSLPEHCNGSVLEYNAR